MKKISCLPEISRSAIYLLSAFALVFGMNPVAYAAEANAGGAISEQEQEQDCTETVSASHGDDSENNKSTAGHADVASSDHSFDPDSKSNGDDKKADYSEQSDSLSAISGREDQLDQVAESIDNGGAMPSSPSPSHTGACNDGTSGKTCQSSADMVNDPDTDANTEAARQNGIAATSGLLYSEADPTVYVDGHSPLCCNRNHGQYQLFCRALDEAGEPTIIIVDHGKEKLTTEHTRTEYDREGNTWILPETVTSIADDTFSNMAIVKVVMPGVKNIGNRSFYLARIESLCLPDTLEYIGDEAFTKARIGTFAEEGISLSNKVRYIGSQAFTVDGDYQPSLVSIACDVAGNEAFANLDKLEKLSILSGCSYIGTGAFKNSTQNILELVLPSTLQYVGPQAFACFAESTGDPMVTAVKNIRLSDGLERIGAEAFQGCLGLSELSIPSTVRIIGEKAFALPDNLVDAEGETVSSDDLEEAALERTLVLPKADNTILSGAFENFVVYRDQVKGGRTAEELDKLSNLFGAPLQTRFVTYDVEDNLENYYGEMVFEGPDGATPPQDLLDAYRPATPAGYSYAGVEVSVDDGVVSYQFAEDRTQTVRWTVKTIFTGGKMNGKVVTTSIGPVWAGEEPETLVDPDEIDGYDDIDVTVDEEKHIIYVSYISDEISENISASENPTASSAGGDSSKNSSKDKDKNKGDSKKKDKENAVSGNGNSSNAITRHQEKTARAANEKTHLAQTSDMTVPIGILLLLASAAYITAVCAGWKRREDD